MKKTIQAHTDLSDMERINPDIKETDIGVRKLRTIKLYPLSMADQIKMSGLISQGLQTFFSLKNQNDDVAFVTHLVGIIQANLADVLDLVTDEKDRGEDILSDITNNQALQIAEFVYEVNYAALEKKVRSLFGKIGPVVGQTINDLSLSKRSSQQSSDDTLNTDSKIVSDEAGETEE